MPDFYVDTDVSPGGTGTSGDPYASWNEAWTAEASGITTGTYNFFFRGTTADTTAVSLSGYSGTGDLEINFYPWHTEFGAASDADDGWYQGDDNYSTSHYRLEVDNGAGSHCKGVIIDGDNETSNQRIIRIQGLQIKVTSTGGACRPFDLEDALSGNVYISGNRLWNNSSGSLPYIFRTGDTLGTVVRFENNVFFYNGGSNFNPFDVNDVDFDFEIINNTIISTSDGGNMFSDAVGNNHKVYNNAIYCPESINFGSSGTVTYDYNATNVAGTQGTNGFACVTGDFTSYGGATTSENTPAASQTNAWGAGGITNGDDSDIPTTDIRGNARNTGTGENTAIGAFAASGEGASSDTEVSAAAESLTLTTNAASVAFDVGVSAASDALTLTTHAATVAYGVHIAANAEALTVSTYTATITEDIGVSATTGNLTLTTNAAAVSFDVNVSAATDVLTVTTYPASLSQATEIAAQTAAVSLTAYPAAITYDVAVEATTAALSVSTYAATIVQSGAIAAQTASLALTTQPATVSLDVGISAGADSLTLTTNAATIEYGVDVSAAVEALSLVTNAATIGFDANIQAAADALNITTYAALIGTGTRRAATEAQSRTFAIGVERRTRTAGNDGKSYAQ